MVAAPFFTVGRTIGQKLPRLQMTAGSNVHRQIIFQQIGAKIHIDKIILSRIRIDRSKNNISVAMLLAIADGEEIF